MFKKIFVLIFIFLFFGLNCNAELIIDDSIHSDIASKYDLDKLPDLPSSLQNETIDDIFTPNEFDIKPSSKYTPPSNTQNTDAPATNTPSDSSPKQTSTPTQTQTKTQTTTTPKTTVFYSGDSIKINKGKKFRVVNTADLSDSLKKGTTINFVSTQTETTKYMTIPKGTVFKGIVEDSHTPNLAGNGGLLVIKVNKIVLNNKNYNINAKITVANKKHIFFNNIKGKHQYWKNAKNSTKKGKNVFNRMWAKTKKYFQPGIEIIISPIAFATGTVVYAANIAVSPILALFSKGGKLTIPKYSNFEIKMLEDTIIQR